MRAPIRSRSVPWVIAHRGDSAHAPENTLSAFHQAIHKGADWIEMDLQLASDEVVVVFHDETLDRLTGNPGRVDETASSTLGPMAVLADRFPTDAGTRVPTLAEVLNEVGSKLPLYLELKASGGERDARLLALVLEQLPPDSPHVLASFDAPLVRGALKAGRSAGLIAARPGDLRELGETEQHQLRCLSLLHSALEPAVTTWTRELGIELWCWTVDDTAAYRRVRRLGVHGICTNDVAWLRGRIEAEGPEAADDGEPPSTIADV